MGKITVKILVIVSFIAFCCCRNSKTPKQFCYHPNINREIYKSDSIYFNAIIGKLLNQNIHPFDFSNIYDKKSRISIDTIFYSPNIDSAIVFAIVQNDLNKFDYRVVDTLKKRYESFFFIGYRNKKRNFIINHMCEILFHTDTNESLKEIFFSYALEEKSTGHPLFGQEQYNMNDIRFWNSKEIKYSFNDSINLVELDDDTLHFLKKP